MSWQEEEQKRNMMDAAERGERRRAQYKKLVRIVGIVTFLALAVLSVDMITRDKGSRLPMDLADPEGTIAEWEHSGFVKSVDAATATVAVDETEWKELSRDEQSAIVVFLGSYCAQKRGSEGTRLVLKGSTSQMLLATADSIGMIIH